MADSSLYIQSDGTILRGREAEEAIARRDANELLAEFGLGDESGSSEATSTDAGERLGNGIRHHSTLIPLAEPLKTVGPDLTTESHTLWKFSQAAETNVYHFSLDLDQLWNCIFEPINKIQAEINRVANIATTTLTDADDRLHGAMDTLTKWGDMAENIRRGASTVKSYASTTADEVKQFTGSINSQAQRLSSTVNSTLKHPIVQNIIDLSDVTDVVGAAASFADKTNTRCENIVDNLLKSFQTNVDSFAQQLIEYGENSGVFGKLRKTAKIIRDLLAKVSGWINKLKDKISGFLATINGVFEKFFTAVAKIQSIMGILGLDVGLIKEALKNGTIRPTDIEMDSIFFAEHVTVSTKSSCKITGLKLTGQNTSVVDKVTYNSNSGHIDVVGAEATFLNADLALEREGRSKRHVLCAKGVRGTVGNISATIHDEVYRDEAMVGVVGADATILNADIAAHREGMFKRHVATAKGVEMNVANVNASLVDDRDGDETVAEFVGGQLNAFNVDAHGIGRMGTRTGISSKASANIGNVAFGIRRHTDAVVNCGPTYSAFNLDLTIGPPSLQNIANPLQPGVDFMNFTIPFFGSGAIRGGGGVDGNDEDVGRTEGNENDGRVGGTGGNGKDRGDGGTRGNGNDIGGGESRGHENDRGGGSRGSGNDTGGGTRGNANDRTDAGTRGNGNDREDGCTSGNGNDRRGGGIRGNGNDTGGGTWASGNDRDGAGIRDNANDREDGVTRANENDRRGGGSWGNENDTGGGTRGSKNDRGGGTRGNGDDRGGAGTRGNANDREDGGTRGYGNDNGGVGARGNGNDREGDGTRGYGNDRGGGTRGNGNDKLSASAAEDAYTDTMASVIMLKLGGKLNQQQDKKKDGKKDEKKPKERKRQSKLEIKEQIRKKCKEVLGTPDSSADTESGVATGRDNKHEPEKRKPKAKPWGAHGNIHGFSTLSMDSERGITKVGNIAGFES